MAEYIDRRKIREETCKDCTHRIESDGCGFPEPCEKLLAEFVSSEAADVRPVVRGRWIEKYGPKLGEDKNHRIHAWYGVIGYTCSICGRLEKKREPFCNCGADMRGDGKNETR